VSSLLSLCLVWGWYVEGTPAEQASLVERLGSPRFRLREEASQSIRENLAPLRPALREASHHKDPEIRRRALELLEEDEAWRDRLAARWPGWNW
jgi:hypothetical protein